MLFPQHNRTILLLGLLVASGRSFTTETNHLLQRTKQKHQSQQTRKSSGTYTWPTGKRAAVSTGNEFDTGSSTNVGTNTNDDHGNSNQSLQSAQPQQRTLYDILGAVITDSRTELKQKYVALAKLSHPDAMRSGMQDLSLSSSSSSSSLSPPYQQSQQQHDFTEIAAAWRILSDPTQRRRYDRSLRAERLAEDIADFVGSHAGPATEIGVKALEKVALPFLRRTTATTLASFQAAFHENKDITKTFQSAMEAARNAGRAVDQLEWMERAEQLEQAAVEEYRKVVALRNELARKAEERLKLTLHTTNSGITSAEAMIVLENFNQTLKQVSTSVWERANPLRYSVEQEIGCLQRLESDFVQRQQTDAFSQAKFRAAVKEGIVAQNNLGQAEAEEERARQLYEAAIMEAARKRQKLEAVQSELHKLEQVAQKSNFELENVSEAVERQSETVRHALRQKERTVYKHHQKGVVSLQPLQQQDNSFAAFAQRSGYEMSEAVVKDSSRFPEFAQQTSQEPYSIIPDCSTEAENEARLTELSIRRQEERSLADQMQQMEVNAAKLLSHANKLKVRATNMTKQ